MGLFKFVSFVSFVLFIKISRCFVKISNNNILSLKNDTEMNDNSMKTKFKGAFDVSYYNFWENECLSASEAFILKITRILLLMGFYACV